METREFYFEQINALLENCTPTDVDICSKPQCCICQELPNIHYIYTSGYAPERIPYKLSFSIQQKNYTLELQETNIIFKYIGDCKFKINLELTSEEHAILLLQFHAAYKDYLKLVRDRILVPTPSSTLESQLMEGCTPDGSK